MSESGLSTKANILMVDDLPVNLLALEAILAEDYNLIPAHSGFEALAILEKRHDIDVILMDVQMPGLDGFEVAGRIKNIKHCENIPIVFISAIYKEEPFVRKGYEVGGIDYFSKPFDPDILKTKLAIYASFGLKEKVLRDRERQINETEELLAAGRKLLTLLEILPVGVLISDGDGRICQVNEAVSRILGSVDRTDRIDHDSYRQILGWWDFAGKMIKDKNGPLARALCKGESSHNEIVNIRGTDGLPKTIGASASPLLDLDNHIVGAVVIIQDVTESKLIEHDLEDRIAKLTSLGVGIEHSVPHQSLSARRSS